ncbi:MAG: HAMP domain-containing sensor histidine kinase, partial [Gammaproteobacteria bacterium]
AEGSSLTRQGLQRLLLLRSFVTVVSSVGLYIFHFFSTMVIPLAFIVSLIAAVIVSVLAGYWRLRQDWAITYSELFFHVLVDVVFLFILVYYTGGVGNPLISYLLVLLAVAATLLPRYYVYGFAIASILIYTFFLVLDLSSDHSMSANEMPQETTFQLHLVGMWVIFLVSAILISVFITRMATAIRERELNLAAARENELRNEQLVAIGTLAAGTAHALGTPLSTMSVLLAELDKLDSKALGTDRVKQDISLLRSQVTRCKQSLSQLIQYYHKEDNEADSIVPLTDFVADIKDYIVNIHPAANVNFNITDDGSVRVNAALSLKHALINIIENGIKAAASQVNVNFRIIGAHPRQVEISINDDGPGIPA